MTAYACPLCCADHMGEQEGVGPYHISDFSQCYQEYYRCLQCCLVYVPAPFQVSHTHERSVYLRHENSLQQEGYVAMFRRFLDEILPHMPQPRRVLDYGCGYEPVLQQILQRDEYGYGISCDIYDFYFSPAVPTPPRGGYDLIVSTEAFEHFSDPRAEVRRITDMVAVGGYVAIMTRLNTTQIDFPTWYYIRDETHITFFAPETFVWIADEFGYEVVYSNGVGVTVLRRVIS